VLNYCGEGGRARRRVDIFLYFHKWRGGNKMTYREIAAALKEVEELMVLSENWMKW